MMKWFGCKTLLYLSNNDSKESTDLVESISTWRAFRSCLTFSVESSNGHLLHFQTAFKSGRNLRELSWGWIDYVILNNKSCDEGFKKIQLGHGLHAPNILFALWSISIPELFYGAIYPSRFSSNYDFLPIVVWHNISPRNLPNGSEVITSPEWHFWHFKVLKFVPSSVGSKHRSQRHWKNFPRIRCFWRSAVPLRVKV